MNRTRRAVLALSATLLPLASFAQATDTYPERPVRIVVPYPAGGYYDKVARVMADVLGTSLKQNFIVENKVGANGVIGADMVSKAAPDGYTLLLAAIGPNAISPALSQKLAYDPVKDFAPVSLLVSAPNILAVPVSAPARNLKELQAMVQSKGGRANYAHNGVGSSTHLAMELLRGATRMQVNPIPYKGSAPALLALTAGEVDLAFGAGQDIIPLAQGGKLRAIAVGGTERLAALPDVPTVAEQGFPGFETVAWSGLMAPANTPRPIVQKLNTAVNAALKDPTVVKRLSPSGELQMLGGTSEHFARYLQTDLAKWQRVVRENNIQAD